MNTSESPTTLHAPATLGSSAGGGEAGETGADSVTVSGSVPFAIVRSGSAASAVRGRGEAAAASPAGREPIRLLTLRSRVPSVTTATAATATISSARIDQRFIRGSG